MCEPGCSSILPSQKPATKRVVATLQCGPGAEHECGNKISTANFYIVFHSNYGSIMLSFQDIRYDHETDEGWMSAIDAYLRQFGNNETIVNVKMNWHRLM